MSLRCWAFAWLNDWVNGDEADFTFIQTNKTKNKTKQTKQNKKTPKSLLFYFQHAWPVHLLTRLETPYSLTEWVITSSRTVLMNENSGRIRALSWYLIVVYWSHNNKNYHLTRPSEGPGLNAWVSTYHYPRSSRARSQIPVVGVTGRDPGWPGDLKWPGAAV